ncbi:Membrane protein [Clostridiaceae bacterium BL-3]|nr:Membrane protein [Clostridiaceae bacterium BL-3]
MAIYQLILYLSIYMYVIIMPLVYSKFKFMGIPFSGDIWMLVVFFIYFIGLVFFKDMRKSFIRGIKGFLSDYLSISIMALIIIMAVSSIYADYKMESVYKTLRYMSYIILYFIIFSQGFEKKFLKGILYCYIFISVVVGIIGIWDYASGIGVIQAGESVSRLRISSTLENSNNLGAYFILIIFPMIMLAIKEKDIKRKVLYILIASIFLLNILFSFSRNAWLGFGIGCIIIAFMYSLKFLFTLIPIGIVSFFIPQISSRLRELTDVTQNTSRIKIWDTAIMIIKDHSIIGVGNGNFEKACARYMYQKPGLKTSNFVPKHPHNIFLEMQAEMGIFGTAAFVSIIISSMVKLIYFLKNVKDKFFLKFYRGFFVSFVVFILMNLIDDFFSAPKVISFFWITMAILQSYELKDEYSFTEINNLH